MSLTRVYHGSHDLAWWAQQLMVLKPNLHKDDKMSKNWSLALVVFVLGFWSKSYPDGQTEAQEQHVETTILRNNAFGKDNQSIKLFDETDDRIRIVSFGFTRCPDVCPTSLAMLAWRAQPQISMNRKPRSVRCLFLLIQSVMPRKRHTNIRAVLQPNDWRHEWPIWCHHESGT